MHYNPFRIKPKKIFLNQRIDHILSKNYIQNERNGYKN